MCAIRGFGVLMTCCLKTTEWRLARTNPPTGDGATSESALAVNVLSLPASAFCVEEFRGGRIRFICTDTTNNRTATATIYAIDRWGGSNPEMNKGFSIDSLGTVAITFSSNATLKGLAGTIVPPEWFFADTLGAWSSTTPGTAKLTYVGGNIASYSGATDTNPAELLISDFGNASYIAVVFTTMSSIATGFKVNAIIKCDV